MSAAEKIILSISIPNNIGGMNFISQQIIDMTKQYYLEVSKNILSEREYEIIEKILVGKWN